jgi:hypothetical protein
MPAKPAEELTQLEASLLTIAARLLAAVRYVLENPPLPKKWAYLNEKVMDKLVSAYMLLSYY